MRNDIQDLKRSVDALVAIMEDWARWQQGYRLKLGYPTKSAGFSSGGVVSEENHGSDDHIDNHSQMLAVDGVVQEDLLPIERAAILRRYGVAAVFRFRDYEGVLMQAHERLMVLLPKKGIMIL